QVGGALGVAILGSVLASSYGAAMAPFVANLPPEAAALAGDSIGGAIRVAGQIGESAAPLIAAANEAFVNAMTSAVWVASAIALIGAVLTWRYLPAHELDPESTAHLYGDRTVAEPSEA
ncbi:MAG: hypothetical protein OEM39_00990, partial [Acidimicrobiia bacterium]|nr:hypothetical protein [Acidimicrobiia bacterium]